MLRFLFGISTLPLFLRLPGRHLSVFRTNAPCVFPRQPEYFYVTGSVNQLMDLASLSTDFQKISQIHGSP